MLESNTFRMYMMMGGVAVSGVLIALLFLAPVKDVPQPTRVMYEGVMETQFSNDRLIKTGPNVNGVSLTTYEMITFYVRGAIRGNTRHY